MIKNTHLYFIFLICSFISFNKILVNPIYIIGFISIFISFFLLKSVKINKFQLLFYAYFVLFLLGSMVGIFYFKENYVESVFMSSILYGYCILLGAQTILVGLSLIKRERVLIYRTTYNFLILFMFLDFLIRFFLTNKGTGNFYSYKASIFYFDSNFAGLLILCFFYFALFLKRNLIYNLGAFKFIILFILLILTFSRAAIFAFFVSYILLTYGEKYIKSIFFVFSFICFYWFFILLNSYIGGEDFLSVDGSFNSKFYIIKLALDNYPFLDNFNKIFGIGLANFIQLTDGIFAHNILVTLVYEFGLYGILIYLIFLLSSYKKIGKDFFYILLPFFIASFSLFSAYSPFLFVLIACMYVERKSLS